MFSRVIQIEIKRAFCLSVMLAGFLTPAWAGELNSGLSQLETKFYMHEYAQDTDEQRLKRLELLVFGVSRSGSSQERLNGLLAAVSKTDNSAIANQFPGAQPAASTKNAGSTVDNSKLDVVPASQSSKYLDQDDSASANSPDTEKDTSMNAPIDTTSSIPPSDAYDHNVGTYSASPQTFANDSNQFTSSNAQLPPAAPSFMAYQGLPPAAPHLTGGSPDQPNQETTMKTLDTIEMKVMGKVYLDTLSNRLTRLELKVFPQERPATELNFSQRINRLASSVGINSSIAQEDN